MDKKRNFKNSQPHTEEQLYELLAQVPPVLGQDVALDAHEGALDTELASRNLAAVGWTKRASTFHYQSVKSVVVRRGSEIRQFTTSIIVIFRYVHNRTRKR